MFVLSDLPFLSLSLIIDPSSEICIFLVHRSSLFVYLSVSENINRGNMIMPNVIGKRGGTMFCLQAQTYYWFLLFLALSL